MRSAPGEVTAGPMCPREPLAAQHHWALGQRAALPSPSDPGSPSTFPGPLAPGHLYFEMFTKEWENIFLSFPAGNNFCE